MDFPTLTFSKTAPCLLLAGFFIQNAYQWFSPVEQIHYNDTDTVTYKFNKIQKLINIPPAKGRINVYSCTIYDKIHEPPFYTINHKERIFRRPTEIYHNGDLLFRF